MCGLGQPTINRLLKGTTENPDLATVKKLADALRVPMAWLTDGPDDAPIPSSAAQALPALHSNVSRVRQIVTYDSLDQIPNGDFVLIPHIDLNLATSPGEEPWKFAEKAPVPFVASFIKALGIQPKDAACISIDGRSMEPLLFHEDIAIIDLANKSIPSDGGVFAFAINDELMVKKLYRLPTGGVRIESRNSDYGPTFDLTKSQADSLWVIGRIRYRSGPGEF